MRILQPHEVASTIFGDLFAESNMLLKLKQPLQDIIQNDTLQYSPACLDLIFIEVTSSLELTNKIQANWIWLQGDIKPDVDIVTKIASLHMYILFPQASEDVPKLIRYLSACIPDVLAIAQNNFFLITKT